MLDGRGMAKMTPLCQDGEWRVELFYSHVSWEVLLGAGQTDDGRGMSWGGRCRVISADLHRQKSQAEPVNITSQAHSRGSLMQPKTKGHAWHHPACVFSVVWGCRQSQVVVDWFIICWGGMPGSQSKRLLREGRGEDLSSLQSTGYCQDPRSLPWAPPYPSPTALTSLYENLFL